MTQLRPTVWPIVWLIVLCSPLLAPPSRAEAEDPEAVYRACLAEVREEMLRSEMKSLGPKVQETVAGLCRRGDTEAAVLLAVPAAGPRRCSLRVSEAASRAEPKLSREEVGKAYQLCRRGDTEAALAIVEAASPAPETAPEETGPPIILSFKAGLPRPGGPVVLSWETENAGAVYLGRADASEPSGMADRRQVASSGSETVTPSKTTTYSLQAWGMGAKSTVVGKRLTVQAGAEAETTIFRFQARPPVVRRGEASRLTWDVYGASEVSLDGQAVPARGERLVTPSRTTRYVLEAGSGGQTVEEVSTVRVSPFPPMSLGSPIRSIELCRDVDRSGDAARCLSSDGPFWVGDPVQVIVRFAEIAAGEHHLEYEVFGGVPGFAGWTSLDRATGPFQYREGRPAETIFSVPGNGKGTRKIEIVLDRLESSRSVIRYCVECPGHDEW